MNGAGHGQATAIPARRILVMRYRFIGDTILTVPFLRNLRRAYPQATIDVLVGPESGAVLAGCPYANELIPFDTTRFHKYDSGQGRPRGFLSYALELRGRRYDLVFVLKRSLSSGVLSFLTGARYRVGYNTQGRRIFLTHPVDWDRTVHEVTSTLAVLRAAGVPVTDDHLEAFVSDEERAEIERLVPELADPRPHVVIHAAAAHPDKMYPLPHWAAVIARLAAQYDILPFFTGAARDYRLYEELASLSGVAAVNLAGKLTLRQSLALYERMDLAACVDSGPAHMAAAAGTPTVALFGHTDPRRWRPWGDRHLVVTAPGQESGRCPVHERCPTEPCLARLSPEAVASRCSTALDSQLSAAGG